jgi:hypothetical protein
MDLWRGSQALLVPPVLEKDANINVPTRLGILRNCYKWVAARCRRKYFKGPHESLAPNLGLVVSETVVDQAVHKLLRPVGLPCEPLIGGKRLSARASSRLDARAVSLGELASPRFVFDASFWVGPRVVLLRQRSLVGDERLERAQQRA